MAAGSHWKVMVEPLTVLPLAGEVGVAAVRPEQGSAAVTLRFSQPVEVNVLRRALEAVAMDKAVACAEAWIAADAATIPVSEEERLRGGDKKIACCVYVEALREADAKAISGRLSESFPDATAGVYHLLCEIQKD